MNDTKIYEASASYLHATVGYTEMRKRSSPFMWFLYAVSFMWIWNRRFMTDFITTIAGRIYWPDGPRSWRTLWHECVHRKQAIRVGEPWFSIAYLFPQCFAALAVLALGAFITPWALLFLLALLLVGPWPAPWRVMWEREAYLISAVCDGLRGGVGYISSESYLDWMVENHCGWAYYRPSWSRSKTRAKVRLDLARAARLVTGEARTPYTDELIRIFKESSNA